MGTRWRGVAVLERKVALVAGGTAGIGLAVARAFAQAGAITTIDGRRDGAADVAAQAACRFVHLDVADEASIAAALAELDSGAAAAVVQTNLLGTFYGLKHAPAHMNDGGSVVLTSSISAVSGTPFEGLYGATKAAVSALARSAAVDLGPRGIRVNAVQPGPTWTALNPMPERGSEVMAPLGRKGTVEDLVGTYVFLASDASRYLTGQAITVDGGTTLGMSRELLKLLASTAAKG